LVYSFRINKVKCLAGLNPLKYKGFSPGFLSQVTVYSVSIDNSNPFSSVSDNNDFCVE
jgi:hypothetical protein